MKNLKTFIPLTFLITISTILKVDAQNSFPSKTDRELFRQPADKFAQKVETDKDFIVGKLSNGITYYIRKANNPANCADFYIVNNVGSLQEEDNQQGLAHFLEHMAFNGLENFPDRDMLNYLASIGVKFGNNVNAYTAKDRTVYNISDVPTQRNSVLDSVVLILHDWSSFISCKENEIDKERGVIIEEWRRSFDTRTIMFETLSYFEQKGSKFAVRKPIGDPQIIKTFKYSTLTDFYHKWYRPDLQAVVIVGDFNVAQMEERVKRILSTLPDRREMSRKYPRENFVIPTKDSMQVFSHVDNNTKVTSIRIKTVFPAPSKEQKATEDGIKEVLASELIADIIGLRANAAISSGEAKFSVVTPSASEIFYTGRALNIIAIPKNNSVRQATIGLLEEYERLVKYGVSQAELDDAKIARAAIINKSSKLKGSTKNSEYVNVAVDNFTRNQPLSDPDKYREAKLAVLKKIDTLDINNFIKTFLAQPAVTPGYKNEMIIYLGNKKSSEQFPTAQQVYNQIDSIKNTVKPYVHVSKNKLAIQENLAPVNLKGSIRNSTKYNDTKEIDLPGGMKVYWICHRSKADNGTPDKSLSLSAVRLGGSSKLKDENLKDILLFKQFMNCFDLGGIDSRSLRQFCQNNQISSYFSIGNTDERLSGTINGSNLEEFFKIIYLKVTESSVNKLSFNSTKKNLLKSLKEPKGDEKIFNDSCKVLAYEPNILTNLKLEYNDVVNFGPEDLVNIKNRLFGDMSNMQFIFSSKSLTLNEALPYIEKYIANLPHKSGFEVSDRYLVPKKGRINLNYNATDTKDKAFVNIEMIAKMPLTKENYFASEQLKYILAERYYKSIREEHSGTYYVEVSAERCSHPYQYLSMKVAFETNPPLVDLLSECVWAELFDLAKHGPTQQELNNIKLFLGKNIKVQLEKGSNILRPIVNSIISDITGDVYYNLWDTDAAKAVTAKDVKAVAKMLAKQKNFRKFISRSQE